MSYERAVKLIVQNGTLADLEKALSILEQLDDETGTSLDHSMEGPLTDAEFMKVISRFLTIDNYEALKPYLLRTQEKIEKNEVYDRIAVAKLRFASLISKYSYKGDSEYLGNVIPLYSGTELYIKREYIGMLEQQFGTLMMETCVEACTQTY